MFNHEELDVHLCVFDCYTTLVCTTRLYATLFYANTITRENYLKRNHMCHVYRHMCFPIHHPVPPPHPPSLSLPFLLNLCRSTRSTRSTRGTRGTRRQRWKWRRRRRRRKLRSLRCRGLRRGRRRLRRGRWRSPSIASSFPCSSTSIGSLI